MIMKHIILLPQTIAPEGEQALREYGFELRYGTGIEQNTLQQEIQGCSGILVRTAIINEAVLSHADRLQVIAKHGAGVDNINVQAASCRGIQVVHAPLGMTRAVAEYTAGMMLALAKKTVPCDAAFRSSGDFSLRHAFELVELADKTVGIVGMGRIGRAVAQRLLSFEMRIIGYDPYLSQNQWPDSIERFHSLDKMLEQSDFLTLHVPLTPETRGLLSKERITCMKASAFLINAARGEIVDEAALIDALEQGRLAGAGIDVFAQEPPPLDHPFFRMRQVIVSPHNSALTPQAAIRMAIDAAAGIDEVLNQKALTWPVNQIGR